MSIQLDQLLGKLMDLFEKKVVFEMERADRELSFKERVSERALDLEYKKYESQVTNDKDKLNLEKYKADLASQNGLDLEQMRNKGLIDLEKLKNANAIEQSEATGKIQLTAQSQKEAAEWNKSLLEQMKVITETTNPETGLKEARTYNPAAQTMGSEKFGVSAVSDIAPPSPLDQYMALTDQKAKKEFLAKRTPEERKVIEAGYLEAQKRTPAPVAPIVVPATTVPVPPKPTVDPAAAPAAAPVVAPVAPAPSLEDQQREWRRTNLSATGKESPFAIFNSPMEAARLRKIDEENRVAFERSKIQSRALNR